MKGGYINIDCKGLDLTKGSTEQTITGLYNNVFESMKANKPLYAYNCIWGNFGVISPIQVFAYQKDSYTITLTTSTLQVNVVEGDRITIVDMLETETE